MNKDTLNEDTAKAHLIHYFQEKLGLALSDLESETPFTIRLGRSERKTPKLQGRLDLLIRRNGRNLCVVEMKAEGKKLTDDDKKQAISYALLLDQRAPVVFLTNGNESYLYDVWTGNLLNDTLISVDSLYQISPPADFLHRREEALALFLSLSPENLLVFCREQVTVQMRSLRGSAEERDRKYIPEIFVPRGNFHEDVSSFLGAPQTLLVLTGDAGIGKTCELCALAESRLEEGAPVLFYRGSMLFQDSLLKNIAEDVAWTFSEEESPRDLVRRLSTMLNDKKLLIIIDAIDEWDNANRIQDLLLTGRRLVGTSVKLLVSCKTSAWRDFIERRGVSTGIEEYLYGGHPQLLPSMTAAEQRRAIEKYRAFYGVPGAFEIRALRAAQDSPFMLRILFEVASKRGEEHVLFSSLQFFDVYHEQLIGRLGDEARGSHVLKLAARLIFEKESETLTIDELYREGSFETVHAVLPELIQFQILERTGVYKDVRFYFSLLRDYLVAFHVYRWHELGETELREVLKNSLSSGVRVEALAFFYRYSDPHKQAILAGDLVEKAREYLHFYDSILREHFQRLRSYFSPFTEGEIGFVGELIVGDRYLGFYGFRERAPGDEEVLLVPVPRFERSNLLSLYGVRSERGVGKFEHIEVQEVVFEYEIGRRLRDLLDKGLLDEGCSPELAAEVVACAASRDRNVFSDSRAASSAGPLLPLEIARVRRWWRYELLKEYFWRVRVQEKLREKGEGAQGVSSSDFTAEDYAWIRESVERNLEESDETVRSWVRPESHNLLESLDQQLARAFATLESVGIETIEGHPVLPLSDHNAGMWLSYPNMFEEEICRYVERLLGFAFPLARRLIEYNFPTLYREFPSIKNAPFFGVVGIDFEGQIGPFGTLYLCEPGEGVEETVFVARSHESIQVRIIRDPEFRFEVCCDNVWRLRIDRELVGQRHLEVRSLLRPRHDYLGFRGHFSGSGEIQPVIRAVVYDWIRQDLSHVFQRLCSRYGVAPDKSSWELFAQAKNR